MRKSVVFLCVLCVLAGAALFASPAKDQGGAQAPKVYGELDPIYKDVDGDLVADAPENPADQLDPSTLVFAYAPLEDPAVYEEIWTPFLKYLETRLGKPVRWFAVRTYATQVEAMRAGRLHISGFAAGSVQDAVNTAGFIPLVNMGTKDGMVGYRMEFITHKDLGISSMDGLKGRQIAFVSETSNSGYAAPRALLYDQFGLLPDKDYKTAFSGSHENSILGVMNKDYEAAAISDSVLRRMAAGGRVDELSTWLKTIYSSDLFPTTAYGVTNRLKPELVQKIRQAFIDYDWTGTRLLEDYKPQDRFIPANYKKDYEVLRIIRNGSENVSKVMGE
jgi:phosphonate transport system substrate-binding protein